LLKNYQEKGGIIALDQQANTLITQLAQFEAQKNLSKMEIIASDKVLSTYKEELKRQDPNLSTYLEKFANEEYLKDLQLQIAKLELTKDLALGDQKDKQTDPNVIKDYDIRIKFLKDKLNKKIENVKASVFATTPEEIKELTKKIIEEEIKNQSLRVTLQELSSIVAQYEKKFNQLPKSSIEFAGLQRNRESLEKLYLLVEEKFQEAWINEQSQPGNVFILDIGRVALTPSKPNRTLIIIVGVVLGLGFAFGYVFIKNYFDNTVKTPEDITQRNINFLAWIPQIEGASSNGTNEFEFIVHKKPDSVVSEAFKALRTRIQFSKVEADEIKTILVTSSTASEGKTMICSNLAGTFAHSDKKTLIIDCDLRKPRIHNFFNINRYPGLIDYLFDRVNFDEIVRHTEMKNLDVITAGTIPPNPSEMIESKKMKNFLEDMKSKYDCILVDSPPLIAVTDSEILARLVDASILVVSSNTTEVDLMERSIQLLSQENVSFIGTVLNNFVFKSSYGYYYKYYYYYRKPSEKEKA
jgi:tyrosine-protein kinase Etk/Wzc